MTDKFEGCVVREMRRLDELMKNLHLAAKVMLAVFHSPLSARFPVTVLEMGEESCFGKCIIASLIYDMNVSMLR